MKVDCNKIQGIFFFFPVGHSVTVPASACATGHHSLLIVFLHEPESGEASLVEFWKEATTCKIIIQRILFER